MNLTANILKTYNKASAEEIAEGMAWYQTAHNIALEISPDNIEKGAGVLAAMSPLMHWNRNVIIARNAFEKGFTEGGFSTNREKSDAILSGADPRNVLGGNKVRSFYENILDPNCDTVTIDRHAYDVAVAMPTGDDSKSRLSRKGVYEEFAQAYRDLAVEYDMLGSEMQAITWVTWRRLKTLEGGK